MGSGYAQVAIDCLKFVEEQLGATERLSAMAVSFLSRGMGRLERLSFGVGDLSGDMLRLEAIVA